MMKREAFGMIDRPKAKRKKAITSKQIDSITIPIPIIPILILSIHTPSYININVNVNVNINISINVHKDNDKDKDKDKDKHNDNDNDKQDSLALETAAATTTAASAAAFVRRPCMDDGGSCLVVDYEHNTNNSTTTSASIPTRNNASVADADADADAASEDDYDYDGHSETHWVCQFLSPEVTTRLGMDTVRIADFEALVVDHNNHYHRNSGVFNDTSSGSGSGSIVSGASTLTINGGYVYFVDGGDAELRVPENALVEIRSPGMPTTATTTDTQSASTSASASTSTSTSAAKGLGNYTTLVVRVVDSDGNGPKQSTEAIRKNFWGDDNNIGDDRVVSLRSQLASCSYDQFVLQPYEGTTGNGVAIAGGVVEVTVDDTYYKMYDNVFLAQTAVLARLGAIDYDLVLYCMPPGASMRNQSDWIGVALTNGKASYYNGDCSSLNVALHEVGHNLGLGHSGIKYQGYGDRQGFMGHLGSNRKCYNPAKNYNLGWYNDQADSIDPLSLAFKPESETDADTGPGTNTAEPTQPPTPIPAVVVRTFVLNGVSDYRQNPAALVVLRLEQTDLIPDYYIGYNRKDGINRDTDTDGDRITIVRKDVPTQSYGASTMIASLEPGQSFTIRNFNNNKHDEHTHTDVELRFVGVRNGLRDALLEIRVVRVGVVDEPNNNNCKDRTGKFRWINNKRGKTTKKKRNCTWVARKGKCNTRIRVATTTTTTMPLWKLCPESCKQCKR
eukprot:jgi/Psemu1/20881/gm1.20881_g